MIAYSVLEAPWYHPVVIKDKQGPTGLYRSIISNNMFENIASIGLSFLGTFLNLFSEIIIIKYLVKYNILVYVKEIIQ